MKAFAVERATARSTQAAHDPLRRKMDCYGEDAHRRCRRERLVYDQDVHLQIAQLAGNGTLKNSLRDVFEHIVLKKRTDGLYDPARGAAAHREHRKLFEAMERRDVDAEVRIMRAHTREAKSNEVADLRRRQAIRDPRVAETID